MFRKLLSMIIKPILDNNSIFSESVADKNPVSGLHNSDNHPQIDELKKSTDSSPTSDKLKMEEG